MALERRSHTFLDYVINKAKLKNDAALARALHVDPPVISKIRNGNALAGPSLILMINEVFDIPIREQKSVLRIRCISRYVVDKSIPAPEPTSSRTYRITK